MDRRNFGAKRFGEGGHHVKQPYTTFEIKIFAQHWYVLSQC